MRAAHRRRLVWSLFAVALGLGLWRCTSDWRPVEEVEAVRVFGPWVGDEAAAFDAVLDDFTDATGIGVEYVGSSDFDENLRARVSGGLPLPDIAVIPQPALFAELVVLGAIEPLADETVDEIVANFDLRREDLLLSGDEAYLAPYRNNLKSLVWYRPDVFDDNGWTVPESLSELRDFADELAEGEIPPWCFSVESGTVSGWPATDWIEDLVLRDAGVEAYDEWVRRERAFGDDAIRGAIGDFEDLVLGSGHVAGGTQRAVSVPIEDASAPLFDAEPGCAMYKQGSFAVNWFPPGTIVGPDGDVDLFVLPGDEGADPPLLVGGDSLVQFSDRAEVVELMTFLVSADGVEAWVDRGDFLSDRTTVDLDDLDDLDRRFMEIIADADEVRIDASDSFVSTIRELYLAELTEFIAATNYIERDDPIDGLIDTMDTAIDALDDGP